MFRAAGTNFVIKRTTVVRRVSTFALLATFIVGVAISSFQPVQAAIAHRATSTGNNAGGGTSLSIATPTGTIAGDVMVAVISVRGGTGVTITATGWTLINSNDSTTVLKSSTYYRVATANEATTQSFTFATQKASGVITSYSGVDYAAHKLTN